MEVLSLCPFRAGALAWQSAPNAWSLTVVVKATFTIVAGGEATVASVQTPVAAFAADPEANVEDLSPLKPRVDVLVLHGHNEDTATVEVSSCVVPARGPIPPQAPARRLLLRDGALEWAALVLRGEAVSAGPVPDGFDFSFFHVAPREQRIDLLRTGSPVVLNHVLPDQARVETMLPQRKPQAFRIHPQTGKASEIILRCDTLCIDAARGLLVLTFRGIADIDASSQANMGTIVVAAHSAGKKIRADRIERFLRNGEPIEGESADGRHPLEKRYDTVLVAPKGDTVALPEMDGGSAAVWHATPAEQSESSIIRAGLPFQSVSPDAPLAPAPPAPLNKAVGGRRRATLSGSTDATRPADMPFQGTAPPVPEPHLPPPPPEGIFPPPPALLPIAPPPEPPPPIRPPPMLGTSFSQDEKTADLPPGHEQPEGESPEEKTVDLPPQIIPGISRSEMPPQRVPTAPSLAGKPVPTLPKAPIATPLAPKPATAKPSATTPTAPSAPKPGAISRAAPKPLSPSMGAAKPAAIGSVAPKPLAPKGPIKIPAPLGPKLKTDGPTKPSVAPSIAAKKPPAPAAANPANPANPVKPSPALSAKPVGTAKPVPIPMRSQAPTMLFPGAIASGIVAATESPAETKEPFQPAGVIKLEECAALEAELRHRAPNRKTILEKQHLSNEEWTAVHKHWSDTIARETEVGERKLLVAYDTAYVATQERLGIDVGINTHAKLQIATERGASASVLKELGLEPGDQMRIGRVWTQRLADEPARMRELAAAIEKARAG